MSIVCFGCCTKSSVAKPIPTTGNGGLAGSQPRIIDGSDATLGRFPYTVSLQSTDSLSHFCGGSLVAPDVVLSAAHCASTASAIAARINPHFLTNPQESSEILPVLQVLQHPLYSTQSSYDHDLMLLRLGQNSTHAHVRLNPNPAVPIEEQLLTVMGWGTVTQGTADLPEVLQTANVIYLNNQNCETLTLNGNLGDYVGELTDDMMCAYEAGSGSCQGDSGTTKQQQQQQVS